MSDDEQPGSEGARNLRVEREIECLWVIDQDQYATLKQALAWASTQEGWASEGVRVSTLRKRILELKDAGLVEWTDTKKVSARLTPLGKERLQAYLARTRDERKWLKAKRIGAEARSSQDGVSSRPSGESKERQESHP